MAPLIEHEPFDTESLWEGHIVTGLNFWPGKEGCGKDMLGCDLMTRDVLGWPMPPTRPDSPQAAMQAAMRPVGQAIMITLEDSTSVLWQRIAAAAKQYDPDRVEEALARINDLSVVDGRKFTMPDDFPLLAQTISEMNRREYLTDADGVERPDWGEPGPVRMVFIGPLMASASTTVSYNQQARVKLINPIVSMCEYFGIALIVVGHLVKFAKLDNWRDKTGGSKAWIDAARLVQLLWPDESDPTITVFGAGTKSNYGESEDGPVRFKVIARKYADPDAHVVYAQQPPKPGESTEQLEDAIRAELESAGVPLDMRVLAARLSVSYLMIKAAARRAIIAGRLELAGSALALPAQIEAAPVKVRAHTRPRPRRGDKG